MIPIAAGQQFRDIITASDPSRTVDNTQRSTLKHRSCTTRIVLASCLLNSAIATAEGDGKFVAPSDTEQFRSVLEREYPDYSLFDWPADMRGYRESPEHFVGDLLFGDFNFDGVLDFSAMLSRGLSENELAGIPKDYREFNQRFGLTVVCNGISGASSGTEFRCSKLTDEELGGNIQWLDLTDVTIWLDDLKDEIEAYNNPDCPSALKSQSENRLLSLVQPIGHCDSYFYPLDSGGYGRCMYCAD